MAPAPLTVRTVILALSCPSCTTIQEEHARWQKLHVQWGKVVDRAYAELRSANDKVAALEAVIAAREETIANLMLSMEWQSGAKLVA